MKVVFRVDASIEIGTGHVMRCLTLANALAELGHICSFVCRAHKGNLIDLIHSRDHDVYELPFDNSFQTKELQDGDYAGWLGANWQRDADQTLKALAGIRIDWLVVDHYALDANWESLLRTACNRLMVIDDLANRHHDCDLLLDQNLGRTVEDYSDLLPKVCKVLVGPQYALLRPEFSEFRQYSIARRTNPTFKHLLISMGGVDKDNITGQVLNSLKDSSLRITIVMGQHAPWLSKVRDQAKELSTPTEVLVNVDNMAQLMANSDLAIGAAGSTSWERCCLGLPTIIVVLAKNQYKVAMALSKLGCAISLGDYSVDEFNLNLKNAIQKIILTEEGHKISQLSAEVTDGEGCKRVARLMKLSNDNRYIARLASIKDEGFLFELANEPLTRANSFSSCVIDKETHHSWFLSRLESPNKYLIYVVESVASKPIGQVRFENNINGQWEVDYSLDFSLRGQGLGKILLKTALDEFYIKHPDAIVIAKVKAVNLASSKVFDALHFEKISNSEPDTIIYTNVACLHRRANIVIATPYKRNIKQLKILKQELSNYKIIFIDEPDCLNSQILLSINPEWVFFPHWSWIIPKEIYEKFKCVIFHMTDLPYGRGGSPLQNLIIRGHKETLVSAVKCVEALDAGPIYSKRRLGLEGTAEEILQRASEIIKDMIVDIVKNDPIPVPQVGRIVEFKRRKHKDGNVEYLNNIEKIYDYIRMLDAEGYPPAFFQTKYFQFDLTEARWVEGHLEAKVSIRSKQK